MMSNPQVFIDNYSEKSIVVRSEPEDYFKQYSAYLSQLGRFNPNLRARSGQGKEPGWIFPKSKETDVQTLIDKITSGELATKTKSYEKQKSSTNPLGSLLTGQQIMVYQPKIGETMNLVMGDRNIQVKVKERNGNSFIIELPDGQMTKMEAGWKIPGFTEDHSIVSTV